jgi:hypothetical protein
MSTTRFFVDNRKFLIASKIDELLRSYQEYPAMQGKQFLTSQKAG